MKSISAKLSPVGRGRLPWQTFTWLENKSTVESPNSDTSKFLSYNTYAKFSEDDLFFSSSSKKTVATIRDGTKPSSKIGKSEVAEKEEPFPKYGISFTVHGNDALCTQNMVHTIPKEIWEKAAVHKGLKWLQQNGLKK